jgi:hypothetical protein
MSFVSYDYWCDDLDQTYIQIKEYLLDDDDGVGVQARYFVHTCYFIFYLKL